MIAPFATQRDPRFFPNPDSFDPENFTLDKVGKRSPYSFLPFSAGPRNCIGQKIVSTLSELENRGLPELVLKPSRGFPVRIEPRY
uniref:Cytochrome P450 n=1 Tax=Steinernema glaseri TaxID=37863 RepID=A0A1I7YPD5_9BILA